VHDTNDVNLTITVAAKNTVMTIYNCLTAIFPGEPDSTTSGPSPPVPEQNLWELNQLIEQDFYQLDIFPATKAMKGTQSTGPNQWLANR